MMIILFINFYLFHIQLLYKIHNIEINLLTITNILINLCIYNL